MITLKLEQGSEAWIEARLGHFTASEAAAMMGDSKYMSRNELLKLKKTGKSKPINHSKQSLFDKGHAAEANARPIIEEIIGEDLYPVTGVLEDSKYLASFDGLTALRDIVFEHKLWNETLAENVRNNVLEPHYYWQLEQQMLVSGAEKAIFVTSDGTEAKMERMEYISSPSYREALIAGWYQFEKDLADYQVEVVKEATVAAEVESFPLITYQVAGTEISSNIVDCLDVITQRSQVEIARVLETDQDFADKDQLNKATIKARASLKTMLKEVEGKFVSYSEFATVAAQIDSVLQKMQSHGEKQVREAKAAKKESIELKAEKAISDHASEINKIIEPIHLMEIFDPSMPDFKSAMKGKRTMKSLQNAVDEVIAKFKIDTNQVAERVKVNLTTLRELAGDYKFLFTDTPQLVIKDNEDLVAVIKTRIADHEKAEKEKADKLREDIRIEEEAKAKKKIEDEQRKKEVAEKVEADKKAKDLEDEKENARQVVEPDEDREVSEPVETTTVDDIPIEQTLEKPKEADKHRQYYLMDDLAEFCNRYQLPKTATQELFEIIKIYQPMTLLDENGNRSIFDDVDQ